LIHRWLFEHLLIVRRNIHLLFTQIAVVVDGVAGRAGALQAVVVDNLAAIPGAIVRWGCFSYCGLIDIAWYCVKVCVAVGLLEDEFASETVKTSATLLTLAHHSLNSCFLATLTEFCT